MVVTFLDYVEIKTKITSTLTFLLTIAFLLSQGRAIDWPMTMLFFGGMFFFDMTATAINNYIDSKDNGQVLGFSRKTSLLIIYILFGISSCLGLLLAYHSDLVILGVGAICFLCGILYTYGPLPISRMPFGEFFSGFFYGVLIPFILMYINLPKGTFLSYRLSLETISVSVQVIPLLTLLLFSIVPFALTANIMLANNICDLEKDIMVKRYTLPYYIGDHSLYLFAGLYYLTYLSMIVMVLFRILSPVVLISLATIFPVQKNIRTFFKEQVKETTFNVSIINFILIMIANSISILITLLIKI